MNRHNRRANAKRQRLGKPMVAQYVSSNSRRSDAQALATARSGLNSHNRTPKLITSDALGALGRYAANVEFDSEVE